MNYSTQSLYEFIDSAVKSRKYPESTAQTLRAAIKLYEQELNDEEKSSVKLFKQNLDQIAGAVFAKNKLKFSAGSLATYKSRVVKVINDFERYGTDPAKMAGWSPKVIVRTKRSSAHAEDSIELPQQQSNNSTGIVASSTSPSTTYVKNFGEGRVAQLVIPNDLSDDERTKLSELVKNM